jgi:Flp pilus assembly protein TadB
VSKPTPAANDDARETPAAGKGRPTPTRAEREAANRRPLVANTKEARAAAKADLQERRQRARVGMEAGEDKYLPTRDKGPQRRWVRDYVDAGWHISEWLMAAMLVVILLNLVPIVNIQLWAMAGLWGYMLFAIGDMVLLSMRVKSKAAAKFGAERRERGLGWYAAMRALQMRFMRLPKPQVKRGQYPA